jgi:oligopeptide/dipeptide ABC transporter ATP-binding protein
VVDYLCDRVAVMYLGQVVEDGTAEQIFEHPRHPYTNVLLASVPQPDRREPTKIRLSGELPNPADPPPGCPFAPRCYRATPECSESKPPLVDYGKGHEAACFYADNPIPP